MTLDDVIVHVRQFIMVNCQIVFVDGWELANILQPLVGKTEHHTENSQELVKEMTKPESDEGESFVSYDVVSLFTKTPIKEACEIIRKRLENDKTLKKRTNLNVDDIMELLKFCPGDDILQIWRRNLPAEVWSSHGQSGIPHCCHEPVHGGPGAENNSHSTGRLPTEKLETICGRCNLPGTHGKGKEITTTHEHCRPHREHHFHAGRWREQQHALPGCEVHQKGRWQCEVYSVQEEDEHWPKPELCVLPPQISEHPSTEMRAITDCPTCTMTSFSVIGTDEVNVILWWKPQLDKLNTPRICKIKVIWLGVLYC